MKPALSRTLPLLSLSLAFAACTPSSPSSTGGPATPSPAISPGSAPAPLAKAASTEELQSLAKSNNAFAVDLYGKVRGASGNLVLSPFSITSALAMTWAGARGETAAQMAKVLHLGADPDRALDVAGSLVASYGAPDNKVKIQIANRLFGEQTYGFEKPFLSRLQTAFGAPLEPLDFKGATEASRMRINGWAAEATHDRIKDLVPPSGVTKDTRLALVNAIHFLGDWAVPFAKESTASAPFFTGKSEKKDVPTMHQKKHLHFAAIDGVKVLELPYQNGALAMDFVLPDATEGLDALEARLTPQLVDKWLGAAASEEVVVSLPKFEIAPAASISLGDALSALGMPLAFDRRNADFTGMAKPPNPDDRLYVSSVFHKGFIRVDEKGTEAAAATAVMAAIAGAEAPAGPPKEFKADHPFLFFLRDTRSGLVLFMGRVADPASK